MNTHSMNRRSTLKLLSLAAGMTPFFGCKFLGQPARVGYVVCPALLPTLPLEKLFEPDGEAKAAKLSRLVSVLIPAAPCCMPSGLAAGVMVYLRFIIEKDQGKKTLYAELLNKLGPEFATGMTPEQSADFVRQNFPDGKASPLRTIREDCMTGYFAHPRHRDGSGEDVWAGLRFRPILRPQDQLPRRIYIPT